LGWQISHPLLLQASLRSTGCLIASFAAQMTLSAGIIAIENLPSAPAIQLVTQDSGAPE
jgi:hypothetical protein